VAEQPLKGRKLRFDVSFEVPALDDVFAGATPAICSKN
jgi:hypothetical protein